MCWCMGKPVYDVIIGNIPGAVGPGSAYEEVKGNTNKVAGNKKKAEQRRYKSLRVPKEIEDIGPNQNIFEQQNDISFDKIRN